MLLSILFLTSAFTLLCVTGHNTDFVVYGTLISFMLFVFLSIPWMIHYSKSDVFKKYAQSGKMEKPIGIIAGLLIPASGAIGMTIARVMTGVFDIQEQVTVYIAFACFVILSMCFFLGNVNWLKYYYCVKYHISL